MSALGLMVDGPAQWSQPIRSRAPGIFVVELPGGEAHAPIDGNAIQRWLERTPDLLLDGERPTAHELGRRLAQFWLPSEPILFVGRSAQRLERRVAAMYATPLGDDRPYSAANWLKTLSVLARLRVWWAETDAHEEYLDAVLTEVAQRNGGKLPFANLLSTASVFRAHGLQNAVRQPDEATSAATHRPVRPAPARRRAPGATARTTRRKPASAKAAPPAPEPTYLSQEGLDRLTGELHELRTRERPAVIARVKAARELGDLKENAEYEAARKDQSFLEGRIQALEAMLRQPVVIDTQATPSESAHMGSTVVVEADGEQHTFVIVGSAESDPAAGRISYSSPVGQALMGARAGDEVDALLPRGPVRYRVREVR